MFERPEVMRMASASAAHAAARIGAIARNVANADTPGYRASDLASFSDSYRASPDFRARTSRPGHFSAEDAVAAPRPQLIAGHMSPNGNNVSLEDEMMRAALVRKDHDTALAIYKNSLNILRLSLGRR